MGLDNGDHGIGAIDVSLRGGRVLECHARGFISREIQIAAYRAIDDVLRRAARPMALLWDSMAVDGFEPGLPMALTRFLVRRVPHFSRAAVVAQSLTILAVSRAVRVLLPPFPYAVFGDRSSALAFLDGREADVGAEG